MRCWFRLAGRRRIGAALVIVGALAFGAWTAFAQTISVGPTPAPLPGSQFQGGDGNQDNATGLIDWQGLQADGRAGHTSDPQADDNIFTQGSKELEPGQWVLGTSNGGATPAAGNVLDIYRGFDHPQDGDAFVYLAFTREASTGTIFVTFELNQDARTWTNAEGATIPCRTTGDILISFDNHGTTADVKVDRWVTDDAAPNGCARTGHLQSATLTPNVDVQASFNYSAAITNFLPGFFGASVPQLQFGEAAINLTKVMSSLPDPCAVFGSTWMHSRSSLSDTADMKDFVAPEPFRIRTCRAEPQLTSSASGRVNRGAHRRHRLRRHRVLRSSLEIHDTATLSGGDDPTGTITFRLHGPGDVNCSQPPVFTSTVQVLGNGPYQSGSFAPTAAGTYRWVVEYSGDINNTPAGPTACGEDTETVAVAMANPTLTSAASGPVHLRRTPRALRRRHHRRTIRLHTVRATQPIQDTATLQGGIAPTGTLTWELFGPHDPNCSAAPIFTSHVDVNGNGPYNSEPFTPTAAGTYLWRVTYSGDANNNPVGPTACGLASETVVVSRARPTIVTVASGSVTLGDPISDEATLSGGADPTGTITFRVFGPNDDTCTGTPADTSSVDVAGNGTYPSAPFTPTQPGAYRWVASYSGDDDNEAASTACNDPGEGVVVFRQPPAQPELATTAAGGGPAGSPIRDTAHLTGGSNPTGTIVFRVYGPDNATCAAPPAHISTVTVAGEGDYTSPAFTPAEAGTYRWVATYSGDEDNSPAGPTACGDPAETVVVSKAQPRITTVARPVTLLGSGARDRALLAGGSKPTGTITFQLFGPADPTCSGPPAFTVEQNVSGNGIYRSPTFVPLSAGRYHWIATYSGDANNEAAATRCGDQGENVFVPRRRPVLTTSASPPANLGRGRRVQRAGRAIFDSARLAFGFGPTGSITFTLFGPNNPTCAAPPIFTTATDVNGNGVYNSERFTPTVSGVYRWVATYSGDHNNRPAGPTRCGDRAERVRVIVPATPRLTTSASQAVALGGAVHDTAHLTDGAAPRGVINFRLFGPDDTNCSGSPVFTSTLQVAGNGDYVSADFVPTAPGVYRWVARYSGDRRNDPAGPTACGDSAELAIVRPPDVTPVTPGFATTASASPGVGGPISDTAHLSGGIAPFGTITFSLFGPDDQTCSRAPIFVDTVAVNGNGDYRSASFVVPLSGTYRWVATYSGDAMNTGVGPTACGDPAETTVVSGSPAGNDQAGVNVRPPGTRPPQGKQKSKRSRQRPRRPIVTG